MQSLHASIAFSRRCARKLQMHTVAQDLSRILFELSQFQKKECSGPIEEPSSQQKVVEMPGVHHTDSVKTAMTKKRRKQLHILSGRRQADAEDAFPPPEQVPQTTAQAMPDHVEEKPTQDSQLRNQVLPQEYDQQNLRQLIRAQLQQFPMAEQVQGLPLLCEKALQDLCQSNNLPLEIRIFRARLHIAYLEELMVQGQVPENEASAMFSHP
eukprot:Skav218408  [mRNA]  locus=scaffold1349:119623:120255:+ [translate_table: standard]